QEPQRSEVGAVGPDLIRDLDTLGAHDGQVAPATLRAAVQVEDRPELHATSGDDAGIAAEAADAARTQQNGRHLDEVAAGDQILEHPSRPVWPSGEIDRGV